MKKIIIILYLLFSTAIFASSNYFDSQINYANYLHEARNDYSKIYSILDKAADYLSEHGESGISKLDEKFNDDTQSGYGIFVIDPVTGKLLLSPAVSNFGDDALHADKVNCKALAKEAIQEARAKLTDSPWDRWNDFAGTLYNNYFTRIAITDNGKVYVLAIGKSNLNLQHLFVEKVVSQACEVIKNKGINAALEIFEKPNSIFLFKDNYIFVYQYLSDNQVDMVYNPNYPEKKGDNMIDYKPEYGYPVRKILKYKKEGSGWVTSVEKIPGEKKLDKKHVYVKFVKSGGKTFIVGSGVYLVTRK